MWYSLHNGYRLLNYQGDRIGSNSRTMPKNFITKPLIIGCLIILGLTTACTPDLDKYLNNPGEFEHFRVTPQELNHILEPMVQVDFFESAGPIVELTPSPTGQAFIGFIICTSFDPCERCVLRAGSTSGGINTGEQTLFIADCHCYRDSSLPNCGSTGSGAQTFINPGCELVFAKNALNQYELQCNKDCCDGDCRIVYTRENKGKSLSYKIGCTCSRP